ncbi:MAG: 5-(carboxyamino)imidazole ribonucleotide synthase [Pseudomonadota bacterium]
MATKIGIVGGGQLGRMLGLAAVPLNLSTVFLDPSASASASVVGDVVVGAFSDPDALDALVARCDVITYEFENVDVAELQRIARKVPIIPSIEAVGISQQRHVEKAFFESLGLGVAPWGFAATAADIPSALARSGLPAIVKTDRLGYDGKGQQRVQSAAEATDAFVAMGEVPVCIEGWVPFDFEVSVIGSRASDGSELVYALTENRHRNGILAQSRTVDGHSDIAAAARDAMQLTVRKLAYVGTLAIEFFVLGDELLVNEFAPRVHNSGHWTIDGAVTSQFANHMRAVAGLPLGDPTTRGAAGMQNFIGAMPAAAEVLAVPGATLHDYGKSSRAGRKVGHANIVSKNPKDRDKSLDLLDSMAQDCETQPL